MGRIAVIKMNILPKMFLFQTIPVVISDDPFKSWQRDISNYIWQGKKARIKCKILLDAKRWPCCSTPKDVSCSICFYVVERMVDVEK